VPGRTLTRDEKVQNLVLNLPTIFTALFEDAFGELASAMAGAMTGAGAAMAEALGGKPAPDQPSPEAVKAEVEKNVTDGMKKVFDDMRKEMAAQLGKETPALKKFFADPAFDKGVAIVESHPLKIPLLTEKLSDADLATYVVLVKKEDPSIASLFKELMEWQKSAPTLRQ
jgi:hypothetical protein